MNESEEILKNSNTLKHLYDLNSKPIYPYNSPAAGNSYLNILKIAGGTI